MASKSKKTTVTSSSSINASSIQSPQSSSTPRSGSRPASSAGRSGSPLSPTRQSRLQEKESLQNLNDRLAAYIDRVRHLEGENGRLTREVQTSHETVTREVSNIKGMYEHELADARKLLDETAREKAKLEIDVKRLCEENEELRKRLDKKTKDLTNAENTSRMFENRFSECNNKYNMALADKKKAQDDAQDLAKELEQLRKLLLDTRKAHEDETLCRIDLENTLQSYREELMFKDQIYQQELTETRSRRQVEISEIDGRLAQQYEVKLQQSLQELREQQEAHVRANREELETRYDSKLKALQAAAGRNSNATGLAVEELRSARLQVDGMNLRISDLEASNSAHLARCRDLEKTLQSERARHAGDLASLEAELSRLRDEMAEQLKEYAQLMDIKTSLDLEIATYRTLLQGEEERLNLTPTSPQSESMLSKTASVSGSIRRTTPIRTARKRVLLDESEERSLSDYSITSSAKGDLEISEVCPEGGFIKVHNKGKKEISLSGCQLVRRAGSMETIFRFHRSVKLDGGATATVWSADSGHEHEPPHSIVMKGQKWFVADNMNTVLLNSNQEEIATSERQRRQVSTSSARHRELSHKLPRHEYIDVPQGEEKCSIM